jgi:hypothetical protein
MDELADEFGGHCPGPWVWIVAEVAQGRLQDEGGAGRARAAFAPVTGQGVEGGDPDLRVGVVGHGGKLLHGFGVDQVVKEAAAAFPDSRALMSQAVPDRGHRTLAAPQQRVIGADGALGIAQGFDESLVIGPGESEHGLSFTGR